MLLFCMIQRRPWEQLIQKGVPVCMSATVLDPVCGLRIEQEAMVVNAVRRLAATGVRRPMLVSALEVARRPDMAAAFDIAARQAGLPVTEIVHAGSAGRNVLADLAERPPSRWPDGLVCIDDDQVALQIASFLAHRGGHTPPMAVLASRQAPLAFPFPVLKYELDLADIARRAAGLVLDQLQSGRCEPTVQPVEPRFNADDNQPWEAPVAVPAALAEE